MKTMTSFIKQEIDRREVALWLAILSTMSLAGIASFTVALDVLASLVFPIGMVLGGLLVIGTSALAMWQLNGGRAVINLRSQMRRVGSFWKKLPLGQAKPRPVMGQPIVHSVCFGPGIRDLFQSGFVERRKESDHAIAQTAVEAE